MSRGTPDGIGFFAGALRVLAVVALAATLACQSGRAPAEAALRIAQTAVDGARAEAQGLLPDDVRSLEEDLAAGRRSLEEGDYKAALAAAQSLQQRSNEVIARVRAKREEALASWTSLSAELPGMVEALSKRIDALASAKPPRLSRAAAARKVTQARREVEAATATWNAAIEAHRSGNVAEALAKGQEAKAGLQKAMGLVGALPAKSR